MKKQLLTIGAVALATLATQQAAHATLTTVSDGTATFNSAASGTISVGFDVVYDSTKMCIRDRPLVVKGMVTWLTN